MQNLIENEVKYCFNENECILLNTLNILLKWNTYTI